MGVKPLCDDSVQHLLARLMPEMYSDGLSFSMGVAKSFVSKTASRAWAFRVRGYFSGA